MRHRPDRAHGFGQGRSRAHPVGYGFTYVSLSDIVRREAARDNPDVSRARQMQDIGNRLRAEDDAGVLGRMVRERILAAPATRWVSTASAIPPKCGN